MARFCTRENEPLKKWNGVPIYLTTLIAAALAAGFLISAILLSLRSPLFYRLMFDLPENDLNWLAALTYPFIDYINFFTPICILFFYNMAVGIETHLGRWVLTRTLLIITLVPVAIACALWWGMGLSSSLYGNSILTAGLIIAFATLYPNAEFWGWVPYKYIAFACLLCGSLMAIAGRQWVVVTSLWVSAGAVFLYIRRVVDSDHDDHVPLMARIRSFFRKKPKLRVVPPPVPSTRRPVPTPTVTDDGDVEIDALLDKIAKSGLNSLSKSERAKLERARQELLKKEQA